MSWQTDLELEDLPVKLWWERLQQTHADALPGWPVVVFGPKRKIWALIDTLKTLRSKPPHLSLCTSVSLGLVTVGDNTIEGHGMIAKQ